MKFKKKPNVVKMTIVVCSDMELKLADLKIKFKAAGFEWDFDKRYNRWLKYFVKDAAKSLQAQLSTKNGEPASVPSKVAVVACNEEVLSVTAKKSGVEKVIDEIPKSRKKTAPRKESPKAAVLTKVRKSLHI